MVGAVEMRWGEGIAQMGAGALSRVRIGGSGAVHGRGGGGWV